MGALRTIDLFAGIGGIRLGFERAFPDSETVFVSEFDKFAAGTYADNFSTPTREVGDYTPMTTEPYIYGDITEIDERDIPSFDICLAGFPCQAFSIAGHHQGFDDDYYGQTRGTLFREVVRICAYHKPKVIFCENVKGLVHHDRGNTFKVIVGAFEQIGYRVFYRVLNSKDFGVPQNRERIYLVCFRDDIAPESFEFPTGAGEKTTIRDILDPAPIPTKYYLSTRYLEVLRAHKARHAAKGHGFGYEIRDLDDQHQGRGQPRGRAKDDAARVGAPPGLPRQLRAQGGRHPPLQAVRQLRDDSRDSGDSDRDKEGARGCQVGL